MADQTRTDGLLNGAQDQLFGIILAKPRRQVQAYGNKRLHMFVRYSSADHDDLSDFNGWLTQGNVCRLKFAMVNGLELLLVYKMSPTRFAFVSATNVRNGQTVAVAPDETAEDFAWWMHMAEPDMLDDSLQITVRSPLFPVETPLLW